MAKFAAVVGFFAVAFGAWQAFASTDNLPPFVEGSRRVEFCGNRQQVRDCYFSVQLPNYQDTIDYQAYLGAIDLYLTYAEEDIVNSDASVVVEMCLAQGPTFGTSGAILCTTFNPRGKVGQAVIDRCKNGCSPYLWLRGSDRAGLGGFDREVNWANFHLRLDSVDGHANLTVGGRRPSVLSAQYNVDSSEICWEAENVPNGDYIILRAPNGDVVSRGGPVSRCAEASGPGVYRIEATGPGQAGPSLPPPATAYYEIIVEEQAGRHAECVNNTCTVVNGPGPDTCAPIGSACGGGRGRNKCERDACVFDPNDSGPDQCSSSDDCRDGGGGNPPGPFQIRTSCTGGTDPTVAVGLVGSGAARADSYTMLRREGSGGWVTLASGIRSGPYNDPSVRSDRNYEYRAEAVNEDGTSQSNIAFIQTSEDNCDGGGGGNHATCVNRTCTLLPGPGVNDCGPIGSACGGVSSNLRVEPATGSMFVGDSMTFAAMYDADGSGPGGWTDVTSAAAWSVSGPARLDGGRVWGDDAGNATVRATYGGATATANLAISEPPPPSCTFTASPTRLVIPPPRSTQLSWNCQYTISCAISPGVGPVDPNSGTVSVSPRETTRYQLDCSGRRRNTSAEVEVGVRVFEFVGGKLKEVLPRFN